MRRLVVPFVLLAAMAVSAPPAMANHLFYSRASWAQANVKAKVFHGFGLPYDEQVVRVYCYGDRYQPHHGLWFHTFACGGKLEDGVHYFLLLATAIGVDGSPGGHGWRLHNVLVNTNPVPTYAIKQLAGGG
jgi:hypothetical protein